MITARALPVTARVERIAAFCAAEVTRQGHDVFEQDDGGIRLAWMLQAWAFAKRGATHLPYPTVHHIQTLGRLVEPGKNQFGYRRCNVRVGDHIGTPHERVRVEMENLWNAAPHVKRTQGRWGIEGGMTADDFYLAFERIHPFVDGNGRVGKILHNWLLGTLDDPVLVADYFGGGNP